MNRADKFMPQYWGDYHRDTRHLATIEHGAYLLLIGHYWTSASPLPKDEDRLRQITGLSRKEWQKHGGTLLAFFIDTPGGWRHKRIDRELEEARKRYEKRAAALEQAGHDEEALKARLSIEKLSKTLDVLGKEQDHKDRLDEIAATGKNQRDLEALRGQNDIRTAETKANGDAASAENNARDYFSSLVFDSPSGEVKYLDMGALPNDKKVRDAALSYAAKNHIYAADKATATKMADVSEVHANLDAVENMLSKYLEDNSGWMQNVGRALSNTVQSIMKQGDIGAFGNSQAAALRLLSTLVAGQGSGFRMTQAEVNMMMNNWPKLTDPLGLAQAKLDFERIMLRNKERAMLHLKPLPLPDPKNWRANAKPAEAAPPDQYRKPR